MPPPGQDIEVNREEIYDTNILDALRFILALKLDFTGAVNVMKFLDAVKQLYSDLLSPLYLQVVAYGGEIIPGAQQPPYYSFSDPVAQLEFENNLDSWKNGIETFEGYEEITVHLDQSEYDKIPGVYVSLLNDIIDFDIN